MDRHRLPFMCEPSYLKNPPSVTDSFYQGPVGASSNASHSTFGVTTESSGLFQLTPKKGCCETCGKYFCSCNYLQRQQNFVEKFFWKNPVITAPPVPVPSKPIRFVKASSASPDGRKGGKRTSVVDAKVEEEVFSNSTEEDDGKGDANTVSYSMSDSTIKFCRSFFGNLEAGLGLISVPQMPTTLGGLLRASPSPFETHYDQDKGEPEPLPSYFFETTNRTGRSKMIKLQSPVKPPQGYVSISERLETMERKRSRSKLGQSKKHLVNKPFSNDSNNNGLYCETCDEAFPSKHDLNVHWENHQRCEECEKDIPSSKPVQKTFSLFQPIHEGGEATNNEDFCQGCRERNRRLVSLNRGAKETVVTPQGVPRKINFEDYEMSDSEELSYDDEDEEMLSLGETDMEELEEEEEGMGELEEEGEEEEESCDEEEDSDGIYGEEEEEELSGEQEEEEELCDEEEEGEELSGEEEEDEELSDEEEESDDSDCKLIDGNAIAEKEKLATAKIGLAVKQRAPIFTYTKPEPMKIQPQKTEALRPTPAIMANVKAKIESKSKVEDVKMPYRCPNDNSKYYCLECDLTFMYQKRFQTHMEMKHKKIIDIHLCKECPMEFGSRSALLAHQKTHEGIRQFKCELCDQWFKLRHGLKHHMDSVHSVTKDYACKACSKQFGSLCSVKAHETNSAQCRQKIVLMEINASKKKMKN